MFCSISGETPEEAVVSKKTGHVFEKRVLMKYLQTHESKCPITGEILNEEDLVSVKAPPAVKPRPTTATSLPSLLSLFQNEWDSLMLETYNLKKELDSVKKELSHTLYQHDASCRVIARLIKERDEARNALANLGSKAPMTAPQITKPDEMDVEQKVPSLPSDVQTQMVQKSEELSQQRRKRAISDDLSSIDDIKDFTAISSNSTHKTSGPGISCLDVHSNQNLIITGGLDSNVVVFNRSTKKVETTIDAHSGTVTSLVFHPSNENVFISTSQDKTAKVWKGSGKSYDSTFTYNGHESEVVGASIHPLGDFFITGAQNGSWALHDLKEGKTFFQIKDSVSKYQSISFHPDGLILGVGTTDGEIKIWDLKSQKVAATFTGHKGPVTDISFSENGFHLASGSSDSVVKLWDLRKGSNFHTLDLASEDFGFSSLEYDRSGSYLAVAGADLRVYAGKTLEHVQTFDKHTERVTDVKWGHDAKFLASTSMDRTLKVWSKKESSKKQKKN